VRLIVWGHSTLRRFHHLLIIAAFLGASSVALATAQVGGASSGSSFVYMQGASAVTDSYKSNLRASFPGTTTAGHLIVATVSWDTSGGAQPKVSDSQGNTYSVATNGNNVALQQGLAIFYAANIKGGADTVTLSPNISASYLRLNILEYGGVAASNPVDGIAQNIDTTGTSTASGVTSGSGVTKLSGDLIIGAVMGDSGNKTTVTAGTGATQRLVGNNGAVDPLASADLLQTSTGSAAATFTFSVAGSYQAQMVAFKAAAAGDPQPPAGGTPQAPAITSATSATGQSGSAFSYQITATNTPTSFKATGLPAGLSINSETGLISGTLAAAGTSSIGLSATNASGTGTAKMTLAVTAAQTSTGSGTSAGTGSQTSSGSLASSGPVSISGQSGTVISGLKITSASGDCVTITNSSNITIKNSEIGPCGGHGIHVSGGNSINVYDSYIHPEMTHSTQRNCCDSHDGVYADGTNNLTIQGNVIAYGEANIEVTHVNTVTVVGNFLLNPINSDPSQAADQQSRGQNFQAYYGVQNVLFKNNYALSSLDTGKYLYPENQEDSVNFGQTNNFTVRDSYIRGGHSSSGCGVIADDGANGAQFLNNTLVDTGQCGIGIADGTTHVIDSNRILNRTPVSGGGNTAIYIWKQYGGACGPVTLSNNTAAEVQSSSNYNSYWNGGGCTPLTMTNNTWDGAAYTALEPIDTKHPAPQIPPQPFACTAVSPYTTQTAVASCSAAAQ
jgi:hypothetical protein